jgi:hypothetical protein
VYVVSSAKANKLATVTFLVGSPVALSSAKAIKSLVVTAAVDRFAISKVKTTVPPVPELLTKVDIPCPVPPSNINVPPLSTLADPLSPEAVQPVYDPAGAAQTLSPLRNLVLIRCSSSRKICS